MAHVPILATLACVAVSITLAGAVRRARRAEPVAVVVLTGQTWQRWRLRRAICRGARQLLAVSSVPPSARLVVVQTTLEGGTLTGDVITTDSPRGPIHVIQLALTHRDRRLPDDEVLATFAEQWLRLSADGVLTAAHRRPTVTSGDPCHLSIEPDDARAQTRPDLELLLGGFARSHRHRDPGPERPA